MSSEYQTLPPHEFQKNPDFEDLTLFTSTFYGDDPSSKLRQELALELFGRLDTLGVRAIVSDGGSNQDFLDKVATHPSVTLSHAPADMTMGEARRFALDQAMDDATEDPDHIFMWLEPEKVNLADADTLTRLADPIRSGTADIVVPRRTQMDTLPRQQAWLERRANHRATQLMQGNNPATPNLSGDGDFDLWFGPKVFNMDGARYFSVYNSDLDKWDSIIAPVLHASRDGLEIADVPIGFTYPDVQTQHEEDNRAFKMKRITQYTSILPELGDPFWQAHEFKDGTFRSTEDRK